MKPKETTITQERVKELIHYDPATGIFTRIKQSSGNYSRRRQIGQPSDHENKNYGMIRIDGKVRELGMFNTREEAHNAYIDAMHDYYGDKAFVIPDKPVKRDSSCHKVA